MKIILHTFLAGFLFVILSIINLSLAQCGQVMNLNDWTAEGGNSNWEVQQGGTTVNQTINGTPTYFVSSEDYINVEFEGTFGVTTTGDDDFIGFVVGYQGPFGASDHDYYLFAISAPLNTQTNCQTFFGKVSGPIAGLNLWMYTANAPSDIETMTCNSPAFAGWVKGETYDFKCFYSSTNVIITIEGDTIVNEEGCFPPGRFGFYNHSQDNSFYTNFTYTVVADFNKLNDNICLGDVAKFNLFCDEDIDNPYTSVLWDTGDGNVISNEDNVEYEYDSPGVYDVTLTMTDDYGCTDSRTKTFTVLAPDTTELGVMICGNESVELPDGQMVSDTGTYINHFTSVLKGCDSVVITKISYPEVEFDAGEDVMICKGDTTQLQATPDVLNYLWDNAATLDDETIGNPRAFPEETTTYTVVSQIKIGDNLVVNGDFEQGNTSFYSGYNYASPPNPGLGGPGYYTVSDNISNGWWGGCPDHTNGTGNMLIADGANGNSGVPAQSSIWCQTIQVVPNTDYAFSTWMINSNSSGNTSDLGFFIDGVQIGQTQVTSPGSCDWDEFYVVWNSGSNTNIEICIREMSGTQPGNDFAIDDIEFYQICTFTNSVTVVVDSLPQPNFKYATTCDGYAMEFTNMSQPANGGDVVDWEWDFGENGSASTDENPSHLYGTDGAYDVQLIVTDSLGCRDTIEKEVIVNPLPNVDFTWDAACPGFPTEFESVANYNVIVDEFEWIVDGESISDQVNANHVFTDGGSYTMKLIIESDSGCVDSIDYLIDIPYLPIADFSYDKSCFKDATCFTDLSTVQNSTITDWEWNWNDGTANGTTSDACHTFANKDGNTVSLTVTSSEGCVSVNTAEEVIELYPLPKPNFSVEDVCLTFPSEFVDESTVNESNQNSIVQWDWDFADGSGATTQNPSHVFDVDGSYNVTLITTTNHGCENDTTLTAVVLPLPVVDFDGANLEGCSPLCAEVVANVTISGGYQITMYDWYASNGDFMQGSQSAYGPCFENDLGYDDYIDLKLVATSNNGCQDSITKINFFQVFHNPIADFYYLPEEPNVIEPGVSFQNTSQYANSYRWNIGTLAPNYDINPIINFPSEAKEYPVELIAYTDNDCTDTTRSILVIADRLVFFVPNTFTPDGNSFNEVFKPVFTHGFDPQDYTFYIFNRWGELVFESRDSNSGWDGNYGGSSGMKAPEGSYVWKIVFGESMSDARHVETGHVNLLR